MHAACHAMEAPHHPIARTELTCLTQAGPSAQLHKTPAVWRVATATSAAAANQNCSSPRLQYPGSHHLWRGAKVNTTGLEVPGSRCRGGRYLSSGVEQPDIGLIPAQPCQVIAAPPSRGKADAPSFSSKQSSHQTKRNNKKLPSTGFKQQPICTPLAPTRNQIIYKTASSDGPNSGSGKHSQNRLRSKGLPSCPSGRHKPQSFIETKTLRFCNLD